MITAQRKCKRDELNVLLLFVVLFCFLSFPEKRLLICIGGVSVGQMNQDWEIRTSLHNLSA